MHAARPNQHPNTLPSALSPPPCSDGASIAIATKSIAAVLPGLKQLYSVAGGAAGWQAAGAPWKQPGLGITLPTVDLKSIGKNLDALAEDFKVCLVRAGDGEGGGWGED